MHYLFDFMKWLDMIMHHYLGHDMTVFTCGALSMLFLILGMKLNAKSTRIMRELGEDGYLRRKAT